MPEPSLFRHYQIVQDAGGNTVELIRETNQVAVLAYDTERQEFVHCHVLLEPLKDKAAFEKACRQVQSQGHPLQTRLLDYGEDESNPFYITCNVDGETLKTYLSRQHEIPSWLAVMVTARALEAALSLAHRSEFFPTDILAGLRVVQTGAQVVQVHLADYQLLSAPDKKAKVPFESSARALRQVLHTQEKTLSGPDFLEALTSCLNAIHSDSALAAKDLLSEVEKRLPTPLPGEIPTANKPRALLAPLFASYQEVARGVINLVRIQSQRLDMANPYSMRGTLTKTGRSVLVEQVPSSRLVGSKVRSLHEQSLELSKKREFPDLVSLVLLHDTDEIVCIAEEQADGISLADILRERGSFNAHEAYLVLAGLDGALASLEKSGLETQSLRLEDLFLITGFPREDARTTKLLLSRLNEWPTFSLLLRAHPTLAAMAGRGLDPAILLPQDTSKKPLWNGAWLSSVGHFLIGLRQIPGQGAVSAPDSRSSDPVARLFEEEVQRFKEGKSCPRADFLARYARLLQQETTKSAPNPPLSVPTKTTPPASLAALTKKAVPESPAPQALTSGVAPSSEKPTIGFAELLFKDTSVTESGTHHDWAKTAADAPPTIHPGEVLLPPNEFVPFWLRAAVFLGGSILAGAVLAHISGSALWQKPAAKRNVPVETAPATPDKTLQTPVIPTPPPQTKGRPLPPEPPPGPAAPEVQIPTLPPDATGTNRPGGLMQPPASTLKDDL